MVIDLLLILIIGQLCFIILTLWGIDACLNNSIWHRWEKEKNYKIDSQVLKPGGVIQVEGDPRKYKATNKTNKILEGFIYTPPIDEGAIAREKATEIRHKTNLDE